MAIDKRRVECPSAPPSTGFRSQGLIAGGFLFVSGMLGVQHHPDGGVARSGETLAEQTEIALGHLDTVTMYAGSSRDRVVELSAFVVPEAGEPLVRDRAIAFLEREPALLHVTPVADVALHGMLELDWIVDLDPDRSRVGGAAVIAPLGTGPTPRFAHAGPFLFRNMARASSGTTLGEQTRALLTELGAELASLGSGLDRLVKLTVMISDYESYPEFNAVTKELFADMIPPARSVVVAPAITGNSRLVVDALALTG
jgi:enamine deaminase RidA (YjgF/YER057c/UK114 family)